MGEQEAAGTAGSQGAAEFIWEMDVKSLAKAPGCKRNRDKESDLGDTSSVYMPGLGDQVAEHQSLCFPKWLGRGTVRKGNPYGKIFFQFQITNLVLILPS